MESKELRQFVVARFNEKAVEFNKLKDELEYFVISILINCKDVIVELDSAKKVFNVIVDEIDERTNTGMFDPIDGALIKGIFEKYADTPKLEEWFKSIRNKALDILSKELENGK